MRMHPLNILVLVLGVWASYQDIRYKKVKNWLLLAALAAFALIVTAGPGLTASWPASLLALNGFIAMIAAVLLWTSQIWPAGDAKLFTVFSLILPFDFYVRHFTPYFPSFTILINTFFIGLAILVLAVVMDLAHHAVVWIRRSRSDRQTIVEQIRAQAQSGLPVFIKSLSLLIVIFMITRMLLDYLLVIEGNIFSKLVVFQFLITFMVYRQVFQFIKKRIPTSVCLVVLGVGLLVKLALLGFDFYLFYYYLRYLVRLALVFIVVLQILIDAFGFYIKKRQSLYLPVSSLRPGMIVDRETWDKLIQEVRKYGVAIGKQLPDGLQQHQVKLLAGNLPAELPVLVNRTYPFAPILFCGVLLTMLLRQSALHLMISLF